MRRREFIAGVGGAAVWPLAARAQQQTRPVIGYLSSLTQANSVRSTRRFAAVFPTWVMSRVRTYPSEYRWITDRYDALPAMAADLVQRQVAVIFAIGPPAVIAAKAASPDDPDRLRYGRRPAQVRLCRQFQ